MKAEFINPFINASINLFKIHLGLTIQAEQPELLKNPETLEDISGIIGLAGQTTGAVVLSFPEDTAIKIVSQFSGQHFENLSNEVLDGVGELTNIIAGNAKRELEDYRIAISIPGVIAGTDYRIHWPEKIPIIRVPFQSNLGRFSLNISLKELIE